MSDSVVGGAKHVVGPPEPIPELRVVSWTMRQALKPMALVYAHYAYRQAFKDGGWYQNALDMCEIELKRAIGPALRQFAPNQSWCSHCGWPWMFAEHHTTPSRSDGGFFVVCEACFEHLRSYGKRDTFVSYCRELCEDWNLHDSEHDWEWFERQIAKEWPLTGGSRVTFSVPDV